jgi:hypothetical protein
MCTSIRSHFILRVGNNVSKSPHSVPQRGLTNGVCHRCNHCVTTSPAGDCCPRSVCSAGQRSSMHMCAQVHHVMPGRNGPQSNNMYAAWGTTAELSETRAGESQHVLVFLTLPGWHLHVGSCSTYMLLHASMRHESCQNCCFMACRWPGALAGVHVCQQGTSLMSVTHAPLRLGFWGVLRALRSRPNTKVNSSCLGKSFCVAEKVDTPNILRYHFSTCPNLGCCPCSVIQTSEDTLA